MVCTFFGHRAVPQDVEEKLRQILTDLILNEGVEEFYVGNQGAFDGMVANSLKKLKKDYPHIRYAVVLAYMPNCTKANEYHNYSDTIYPEGLEDTPPRYAIDKRNRWMLEKADCVITYVRHTSGGAAKFKALAEKKGKKVLNLASLNNRIKNC